MHRAPLLGTAIAALVLAVPAYATPPLKETFAFSQLDAQTCPGFEARIERSFTGRQAIRVDRYGYAVALEVIAEMHGTATNSQTHKTLALRGHVHVTIDLLTGSQTFTGQVFAANERGLGSVIKDNGRIVFDAEGNIAFEAGPHDAIDTDGGVFCTALA